MTEKEYPLYLVKWDHGTLAAFTSWEKAEEALPLYDTFHERGDLRIEKVRHLDPDFPTFEPGLKAFRTFWPDGTEGPVTMRISLAFCPKVLEQVVQVKGGSEVYTLGEDTLAASAIAHKLLREFREKSAKLNITPYPMDQGAPGPEYKDSEGRCWYFSPKVDDVGDDPDEDICSNSWDEFPAEWSLKKSPFGCATHWLPYWALPYPM